MGTMNVSLPLSLKAFVEEQAAQRGYGKTSLQFRSLLLEGAASPPSEPADAASFEALRTGVRQRARS